MKLINIIFVLSLGISIFANNIPNKDALSQSCQDVVEKFNKCFVKNSEDKKNICDNHFNTDECQHIIKKPLKYYKDCKNEDSELLKYWQDCFDAEIYNIGAFCYKDENDFVCPIANLKLNIHWNAITYQDFISKVKEAVNDTCKSKLCTDFYLKYETGDITKLFEISIENMKSLKGPIQSSNKQDSHDTNKTIEKLTEFLNSEECQSQAQPIVVSSEPTKPAIPSAGSNPPLAMPVIPDDGPSGFNTTSSFNTTSHFNNTLVSDSIPLSDIQSNGGAITLNTATAVIASIGLFIYTLF